LGSGLLAAFFFFPFSGFDGAISFDELVARRIDADTLWVQWSRSRVCARRVTVTVTGYVCGGSRILAENDASEVRLEHFFIYIFLSFFCKNI
jgi:hypothetical protein